jgi:hypothetical protein
VKSIQLRDATPDEIQTSIDEGCRLAMRLMVVNESEDIWGALLDVLDSAKVMPTLMNGQPEYGTVTFQSAVMIIGVLVMTKMQRQIEIAKTN